MKKFITSESVTEGHPDKICDQISDAILDAFLEEDSESRVACEVAIKNDLVLVLGEITSNAYVDIKQVVKETIQKIGYLDNDYGFNLEEFTLITSINKQSSDIAIGIDKLLDNEKRDVIIGAGDQGIMFGYAVNETEEFMPMPIYLAHKLSYKLTEVRKSGLLKYLRPDGKTQVTVEYIDDKPIRVDTIVISTQHSENISLDIIKNDLINYVIKTSIPKHLIDEKTKYLINPTGRFVIGGPKGDSGLTGRKIIVDTYGGYARHGGGAFSGKDPTKVDRSASYAARYVAKNIVASGLADKCEIQLAYAIGVAEPVSILVDTFNTGKVNDKKIEQIIKNIFDLRPASIIKELDLRKPIYKFTSAYGHFGRKDINFSWENTDKVNILKKEAIL